jgi:hypothetical protein
LCSRPRLRVEQDLVVDVLEDFRRQHLDLVTRLVTHAVAPGRCSARRALCSTATAAFPAIPDPTRGYLCQVDVAIFHEMTWPVRVMRTTS